MKTCGLPVLLWFHSYCYASAFQPPALVRVGREIVGASPLWTRPATTTTLFSEPTSEGDGLDLDLGEMFEMFEAADKEQDFDQALDKVKGVGSRDK